MQDVLQQVINGLAIGGVYASLALALVLIYQSTEVVNFAQGEIAMFSTFIAWALIDNGMPYWAAFFVTVAISFAAGIVIERTIIRPVEKAPLLTIVVVTLGLFIAFNSLAMWIWGSVLKQFPTAAGFPKAAWRIQGVSINPQSVAILIVTLGVLGVLWAFFRFTTLGLALRASAMNPQSARLVGVRVGWMLALGWGLAATVGAVAGMMAAPVVFLDPNMMQSLLLFAFAAATLGGFDSPLGAVVGGLIMGVLQNLVSSQVPFIGPDLSLTVALAVIILVLLVKPAGLFGRVALKRV